MSCSALYSTGMTHTGYAAHIIADAEALGDPEIIVMTEADETGAAEALVSFPITTDTNPADVLAAHGWRVTDDVTNVDTGYNIVAVEATDWATIVTDATFARDTAATERDRADNAWRTLITNAMNDGGSATRLAEVAHISRERIYQIRDGRR